MLIVVLVILGAVLIAALVSKFRKPIHPSIEVGDVGDRPGVVLFTSTDCSSCKAAIAVLEREAVPFREVTHDLEPTRFETWNIVAVPLTVVLDADGTVVDTMSGVPRTRQLRRALRTAGVAQRG